MSEDIRDLIKREASGEEQNEIRELWKRHSIAEDERDLPGLISTLTPDCVYELAQSAGQLEYWPGVRGAVLAARAATHLGAPRRSSAILRRLRREAPHDPEVRYYSAYWQLGRRGPYKAWRDFLANPQRMLRILMGG